MDYNISSHQGMRTVSLHMRSIVETVNCQIYLFTVNKNEILDSIKIVLYAFDVLLG